MESKSNKSHHKHKSGYDPKNNIKNISKTMCYLLRHEGVKYGLNIESSGFVKLDDLLDCPKIKKLRVTEEIVREIVASDEKGRYELVDRPPSYIRAVQGHSIKLVKDEDILDQLSNIYDYPTIVHGTYYEAWKLIKETGLNKMSRNCIHFSIGHKKEDHVVSGMRHNCEVFIEINAVQAYHNRIKFYISKNKVILTPGLDGVLHPIYFKRVIDQKHNILYSQTYELAVFIEATDINNSFEIKQIYIFDLSNKKVIETLTQENKSTTEFINEFAELFINKEFVKKPFVILIEEKNEESYINYIKTNKNNLNHLSFYTEYIPVKKNPELSEEDLNSIFENTPNLSASNAKRIDIDLKANYIKNVPQFQNFEKIKKTEQKSSDSKYFQLTKAILKDQSIEKNYILMFLNFEEEDILISIDYILIKKDGEKIIPNRFTLESKPVEKNLIIFLDNLKQLLIKEDVVNKLLILSIYKDYLDYLQKKMKHSSLKIPNLFLRNIILLKPTDFSYLETSEYNQAAELFVLQYIHNEEGIDKIKILL